jgi:hypothetical protein
MRVVRCTDDHGIDLVGHLIEHHTEVAETTGLGKPFESGSCPLLIHIAKGNDILPTAGLNVIQPPSSHTNAGDIQAFVGGGGLRPHRPMAEGPDSNPCVSGISEDLSSRDFGVHHISPKEDKLFEPQHTNTTLSIMPVEGNILQHAGGGNVASSKIAAGFPSAT